MLSNARVVPTLAVSDMERARRFYEDRARFGCRGRRGGNRALLVRGRRRWAIFERPMEPVDRTVAAFEVEDIEGEVDELRGRGVEVEGIITLPKGVKEGVL